MAKKSKESKGEYKEEKKDVRNADQQSGRFSEELKQFIAELRNDIRTDKDSRSDWERKLRIATNQRMGLKRVTNRPYKGAPDIPLPETDKQIQNAKIPLILSVIGAGKPVKIDFGATVQQVTPDLLAKRDRAESAFNYVLMKEMNLIHELTVAADNVKEKGHCIFKTIEEFRCNRIDHTIDLDELPPEVMEEFEGLTEDDQKIIIANKEGLDPEEDEDIINDILRQYKSGESIIRYSVEETTTMPKVVARQPENIIVPIYTESIDKSERIVDEFYLTKRELLERGLSGAYNLKKVKNAIELAITTDQTLDDTITNQKRRNEGLQEAGTSEQYKMYEVNCWRPTGKNGRYEKWIMTFIADMGDDEDATVQVIRFPYEFTTWNYDKHDNEIRDNRYYSSRGIPEKIRAIQEFMERSITNMVIRDEIINSPVYTVLTSSKIQPSTLRFIPGQRIQVNRHDEVMELGNKVNRVDLSSNLIIQLLKAFAEEYLGSTDQLFRNATNRGGGKTLGEINTGMQKAQMQTSLELLLWNETLRRVYRKVWSLLKNRIGKPLNVNGVLVYNEDFNFDAEINPTGTVEALDKFENVQKALGRVQMVMQQIQLGLIANAEDLYNVTRDYLEADGVSNPDRYTTQPQIIAQEKMAQAQAQQQAIAQQEAALEQEIAQKSQNLTPEERAQLQEQAQEQPQQ